MRHAQQAQVPFPDGFILGLSLGSGFLANQLIMCPASETDGIVHELTGLADHHLAQHRHGRRIECMFQRLGNSHAKTLSPWSRGGKPRFAP